VHLKMLWIKNKWKEFIKKEYNRLFPPEPKFEPKKLRIIGISQVANKIKKYCNQVYLSDVIYGLCSMTEAKKFSQQTKVAARKWIKEQHDCDEFSFALMGYWNEGLEQFCFGIAWSRYHAFNIMLDHKKQVWIVEPQNNNFIRIEDIKKNKLYWPIRLILI